MASRKKLAMVTLVVAIVAALATVPGIWHYTETNKFCADCHDDMGFGTEEAVSAGLAKYHYEEGFHDASIACEECHRGPGLSGMIDAKVVQAVHEAYHYFALQDRDFPKSGDYPSETCMKEECHPIPQDQHNFSIQEKECINCHSGHNPIHEAAQKATITGPLNCMNCHNQGLNQTHITYNATTQNCTECHTEQFVGEIPNKACDDCHSSSAKTLFFSKHKSESCSNCHSTHQETLGCSEAGCHEEIHEGELTNCEECHTGAHEERKITIKNSNQCLTCHEEDEAVEEIQSEGDAHMQISCTECHNGEQTHGYTPGCSEAGCHDEEPHGPELTDCYSCHEGAHEPLNITLSGDHQNYTDCERCHKTHPYDASINDDRCISCHEDQKVVQGTAHGQINCTKCHTLEETVVNCQECHGEPHGGTTMDCTSCHENGGHNPSSIKNFMSTSNCTECHEVTYTEDFSVHEQRLVCTNCHSDHFETESCLSCHFNPHPENPEYEDNCSSCHGTMTSDFVG